MKNTIKSSQVKYKVAGQQPFFNSAGEEVMMNVLECNVTQDVGWFKVYMANLAGILDVVGNQKMTVFGHIISNIKTSDNMYMGSIRETHDALVRKGQKCGLSTIAATFKLLQESGFWIRVRDGNYVINPDVAMMGSTAKRGNLLITFSAADRKQKGLFDNESKDVLKAV